MHTPVTQFQVNGKVVTSDGSFSPSLEKMEQVFEFLTNASIAADIDLEQDIDFILDIGASLFYDEVIILLLLYHRI